ETGLRLKARRKLVPTVIEVFCKEIKHLRPAMGGGRAPAQRAPRLLDGVADVLAIALADLANQLAIGPEHRPVVAAVRPRLLAANIHFRRLVEPMAVQRIGTGGRSNNRQGGSRLQRLFP